MDAGVNFTDGNSVAVLLWRRGCRMERAGHNRILKGMWVSMSKNIGIEELSGILRQNGIVGAGGAGFPTYAKLDKRADTIIMNCAE